MSFIRVTADQCNPQGITSNQIPKSEFHLNVDLIGAIHGDTVYIKGGDMLNLGGNWYKNFRLVHGQQIPN